MQYLLEVQRRQRDSVEEGDYHLVMAQRRGVLVDGFDVRQRDGVHRVQRPLCIRGAPRQCVERMRGRDCERGWEKGARFF